METEQAATIYLALGSNLGDRRAHLAEAVARLGEQLVVEALSSLYETEPAYVEDQPRFLNAALRGRTTLDPEALLGFAKRVESELGRVAGQRFGPRVVDIDLLLYDQLVLDTPTLTLPHPRMAERRFVLAPLAELAPQLIPPGWNATIGELAREVRGHGDIVALVGQLEIS
jgi:2-amino-4-hydroxy-6-hydroxymethyldihydropteridine diphosphokinase